MCLLECKACKTESKKHVRKIGNWNNTISHGFHFIKYIFGRKVGSWNIKPVGWLSLVFCVTYLLLDFHRSLLQTQRKWISSQQQTMMILNPPLWYPPSILLVALRRVLFPHPPQMWRLLIQTILIFFENITGTWKSWICISPFFS